MKTTNNVQKANLKSAVAAVTLMLAMVVSTSIFAAETNMNSLNAFLAEETEESLEMEAWMTNSNNFYATTNLEAETEESLEIENWMVSENNFYATVTFEAETEEALEVENWMTAESNFYNTVSLEPETEKALEVESWMKSDTLFETQKLAEVKEIKKEEKSKKAYGSRYGENKFGRRAFIMIEEDEPKLKLEQWMLDYKYWNGK
ncbi:hypothetical protein SAMN05444280_10290 [Tangfeifania diversioriginum]|uniref:Uncharacterized protein n=1 Tax=Tangfeifania diversioriginum TaxID=1168035 RepID=A0A1M6B4Y2_9BACT|nr:hypothetical protein [Tangfeifania diversioriginum]SHI43839.1 hypothetical protein SAMN05444280_10290 [Tangfeifania diversioriginum]